MNPRVVIAAVLVIALVSCASIGVGLGMAVFAEGSLHVLGPVSGSTAISVDGGAPIVVHAREHATVDVPRGPHTVAFDGQPPIPFEIELGFDAMFVGSAPDRCYVEFDATPWLYGPGIGHVMRRFRGGVAEEIPTGTVFSPEEAPEEIDGARLVFMVREYDCALDTLDDDGLMVAIGAAGEDVRVRQR
jgi:hypothetical protein